MYGIYLVICLWKWIMQIRRQFVSRPAAIVSVVKLTSYRPRNVSKLRQHFMCTVDYLTTLYQINLQKTVVAKLISRPVNSLPFYGTGRSTIVFTKHPPCRTSWIQPITLRCVLIISPYVRLLQTGLVRPVLASKVYMYFLSPSACTRTKNKRWTRYPKVAYDYKISQKYSDSTLVDIRNV